MAKIPLTIITGFLGSGKTTFLSEILQENADKKLSIIVNEFGEVGLDNTILNQAIYHIEEKTILLQGGCVCCSKREDLVLQLKKILNNGNVEHIIIETTGLANPAPIIFSILTDSLLQHHFFINEILSCVDCLNVFSHLKHEEARLQIAISDKVILTKQELFSGDFKEIVNFIASYNAFIEILPKNRIDFRDILTPREVKRSIPLQRNLHQDNTYSLSISFQDFLDWSVFSIWLSMLLYKYGENILRFKGILDTNEGYPIAINSVLHIIHPPLHLKTWDRKRGSELVFIFKDIHKEELLESFKVFAGLLQQKVVISIH